MTGAPRPSAGPPTESRRPADGGFCAIRRCGLVWVEGPDAGSFLHGLLTCAVSDLQPGAGRLALLLDAKGHVTVAVQVMCDAPQSFTLVTDTDSAPRLAEDLRRLHFSEELEVLGPEVADVLSVAQTVEVPGAGASAPGWLPGTRDVIVDDAAAAAARCGCEPSSADALEVLRIAHGVARIGQDTGATTLVQEALLTDRTIDFTKGCYLGQETVTRAQHRGQVKRTLRGLVSDIPMGMGDKVTFANRVAGTVTSAARHPTLGAIALGILRVEVPDGATVQVGGSQIPATVRTFPLQ